MSFLFFLTIFSCFGAIPQKNINLEIEQDLKSRTQQSHPASFQTLLSTWEKKYGPHAAPTLLKIAHNKKYSDTDRYISLLGASKLGGKPTFTQTKIFLKDPTWMLRMASLKIIQTFGTSSDARFVIPLLKDPALVIRSEAVDTLKVLRSQSAIPALLATQHDPRNFRKGKPLWVPQKALSLATELRKEKSQRRPIKN